MRHELLGMLLMLQIFSVNLQYSHLLPNISYRFAGFYGGLHTYHPHHVRSDLSNSLE